MVIRLVGSGVVYESVAVRLKKLNPTTIRIFTVIAIFMWVTSFLADLINPKYDPPVYVNPIILLVAGHLYAVATNEKEKK